MKIKFINASQAKLMYKYFNTKKTLQLTIANIYFNKSCLKNNVIPKYVNVNIRSKNISALKTKRQAEYQIIVNGLNSALGFQRTR